MLSIRSSHSLVRTSCTTYLKLRSLNAVISHLKKPINRSSDPNISCFLFKLKFFLTRSENPIIELWSWASLIQSISHTLFLKNKFKIAVFLGCTKPRCESPQRINFTQWREIFVCHQYHISILALRNLRSLLDKFVQLCGHSSVHDQVFKVVSVVQYL